MQKKSLWLIECNGNTNETIGTVNLCLWDSYNTAVTRQGAVIESRVVKTVMYSALHQGPFSFSRLYNGQDFGRKKQKTPVKDFPIVGLTRPVCAMRHLLCITLFKSDLKNIPKDGISSVKDAACFPPSGSDTLSLLQCKLISLHH